MFRARAYEVMALMIALLGEGASKMQLQLLPNTVKPLNFYTSISFTPLYVLQHLCAPLV